MQTNSYLVQIQKSSETFLNNILRYVQSFRFFIPTTNFKCKQITLILLVLCTNLNQIQLKTTFKPYSTQQKYFYRIHGFADFCGLVKEQVSTSVNLLEEYGPFNPKLLQIYWRSTVPLILNYCRSTGGVQFL